LRSGWDRSEAEDREPDRSYVSRVAMQAPDHETLQPGSLSLQSHQITDARFIGSSAIVDHQHVPRCSPFERLQENIDAANMSSRTHTPSQADARHHGVQERGRTAHRDLSAKACIRQMGSRQRGEPPPKLLLIHAVASSHSFLPSTHH
jgi:hypothetical protein